MLLHDAAPRPPSLLLALKPIIWVRFAKSHRKAIKVYAFIPINRQMKRIPGARRRGLPMHKAFCETKPILGAAAMVNAWTQISNGSRPPPSA
jgi:hypothetical protein